MFESFKCWSGHSLRTLHNSGVLRRCGMDHMSDDDILDILYEALNTGGVSNYQGLSGGHLGNQCDTVQSLERIFPLHSDIPFKGTGPLCRNTKQEYLWIN